MTGQYLLTLNIGSSSVKFRLFGLDAPDLPLVAGGKVSDIGNTPVFKAKKEEGPSIEETLPAATSHAAAVKTVLAWLGGLDISTRNVRAIAHRIVHGGTRYSAPVRLDGDILSYLRTLNPLAPLHQPHNLAGVDIFEREMPDVPQYGCFDTAFHAGHDGLHSAFALPQDMRARGIRRYGFHGISYDWVTRRLQDDYPHLMKKRVVAAHLGNGASLCAIREGRSIDTTMGMTALDGLPMGTRCGAIDAGAVIYMARDLGLNVDEVERILYEDSGLKGLSGITNDVKALSESADERAAFALDYFCLKTAQHIAAMTVSVGGMDALVFTGGIGENAGNIRTRIVGHLSFLPEFEVLVIPANEERGMAISLLDHFQKEIDP